MTGTLTVHAYMDGVEVTGHCTVSEIIQASTLGESYYHDTPYTFTLKNAQWNVLVTFLDLPYQERNITITEGIQLIENFTFQQTTKGYLTVYGHWDGQEVPVTVTIDGVPGSWTTNFQLELEAGTYTLRGHWLQQDKAINAVVVAGQNTDIIIQFQESDYGYITVEAKANGSPVPAHVIISLNGTQIYDVTLPEINGARTLPVLPGTYAITADYGGKVADPQTVTIAQGGGKLVTFDFSGGDGGAPPNWTWLAIGLATVAGVLLIYAFSKRKK